MDQPELNLVFIKDSFFRESTVGTVGKQDLQKYTPAFYEGWVFYYLCKKIFFNYKRSSWKRNTTQKNTENYTEKQGTATTLKTKLKWSLSHNHRMGKAERDHCGSSSSTSLLKQAILEHMAQCRQFLSISSEGDSITSQGNLFQWSVIYTAKFFLMYWQNFLYINVSPLSLVLVLQSTKKEPWSIFLAPSLQTVYIHYTHLWGLLSLVSSWCWTGPATLHQRCFSPLIIFIAFHQTCSRSFRFSFKASSVNTELSE